MWRKMFFVFAVCAMAAIASEAAAQCRGGSPRGSGRSMSGGGFSPGIATAGRCQSAMGMVASGVQTSTAQQQAMTAYARQQQLLAMQREENRQFRLQRSRQTAAVRRSTELQKREQRREQLLAELKASGYTPNTTQYTLVANR